MVICVYVCLLVYFLSRAFVILLHNFLSLSYFLSFSFFLSFFLSLISHFRRRLRTSRRRSAAIMSGYSTSGALAMPTLSCSSST
jgi:hypothetical protein